MNTSYTQQLLEKLDGELQQIRQTNNDPGKWAGQSIIALKHFLGELKEYIEAYPFTRHSEEIMFYQKIKLPVMSKVIFYTAVSNLWIGRSTNDNLQKQQKYWQDKLSRTRSFFEDQSIFYTYIVEGDAWLDIQFAPQRPVNDLHFVFRLPRKLNPVFYYDPSFSTGADYRTAKLFAYGMVEEFIQHQLADVAREGYLRIGNSPK